MLTIYKYSLDVKDEQRIEMPTNAKMLCVQVQNGSPFLWAQVDTEVSTEMRTIHVYGTGHPVTNPPGKYLSTFQLSGGSLVFHVYESHR